VAPGCPDKRGFAIAEQPGLAPATLLVGVLVSGLGVLISLAAVLLGRRRVLFRFVMPAVLVVVRGLSVMMGCSLVMAGRRVMVFGCGVSCRR
jgi:hypothetical protein